MGIEPEEVAHAILSLVLPASGFITGATLVDGEFGTLTINPDGGYSYAVDQAATAGET